MTVIVEESKYIVVIPEESIRQEFNPETRQPFANETEAQAWQDAYLASIVAAQDAAATAAAAAEQERLASLIHLEITADKTAAAVNESIAITATLKNGHGDTVPMSAAFAVPIENDAGGVEMIKGVAFTAGAASITIAFPRSGYFRITEAGINRKLVGLRIGMPAPFEVTVYE